MNDQTEQFEEEKEPILVLGVGRSGGIILHSLEQSLASYHRLNWIAIDTNLRDLLTFPENHRFLVGDEATGGNGVMDDEELANQCMADEEEQWSKLITGRSLLILVAGLGGATGAALAPLCQIADELQIPIVLLGMMPFDFEDAIRRSRAQNTLALMEKYCQVTICAPNSILAANLVSLPANEAFHELNRLYADILLGIASPFASENLLQSTPNILGVFHADGNLRQAFPLQFYARQDLPLNPVTQIAQELIRHPLWKELQQRDRAIALLRIKRQATMKQLEELLQKLQNMMPKQMNLAVSISVDEAMCHDLQLTLLVRHTLASPTEFSLPVNLGQTEQATERTLGCFQGDSSPIYQDENLDIPAFLRKKVAFDTGL